VPALHRFDVPAVLLVEGVDEQHRQPHAHEIVEPFADPLVPSGHEDEPGVFAERTFPLLREIAAVQDGSRLAVVLPGVIAAAQRAVFAHRAGAQSP